MPIFRYPRSSLIGDFLRSGGGLAAGLAGLVLAPSSSIVVVISLFFIVLFGWFLWRTIRRSRTEIALISDGIACRDITEKRFSWNDLAAFKLRFYGTRREHRNKQGGFMVLTLAGPGCKIALESSIEGFSEIVERAAAAAQAKNLEIDTASLEYLLDLGVEVAQPIAAVQAEEH